MTTKDNIIFYCIFLGLIVLVGVLLYIGEYVVGSGDDKPFVEHVASSQDNEIHNREKSMIESEKGVIVRYSLQRGRLYQSCATILGV